METLAMRVKERRRLEALSRVKAGEWSLVKLAELAGWACLAPKKVIVYHGLYRKQWRTDQRRRVWKDSRFRRFRSNGIFEFSRLAAWLASKPWHTATGRRRSQRLVASAVEGWLLCWVLVENISTIFLSGRFGVRPNRTK